MKNNEKKLERKVSVRFDNDTYALIKFVAKQEERTVAGLIRKIVKKKINN